MTASGDGYCRVQQEEAVSRISRIDQRTTRVLRETVR
jgi:hypothetical protein